MLVISLLRGDYSKRLDNYYMIKEKTVCKFVRSAEG